MNTFIEERIQKMYSRIYFIAKVAFVCGIIGIVGIIFLYVISLDDPSFFETFFWVIYGIIAFTVVGFFLMRETKKLASIDISCFRFNGRLASLIFGCFLIWAIIGLPFLYFFPIWGAVITFVFFAIFFDIIRLLVMIHRYNKGKEDKDIGIKDLLIMAWRLVYPKVKHDKVLHRIITVIGWIVSLFSWLILFPIYFGIIQRLFYFVIYGKDKEKWLDSDI